ncbi:MAG: signal peptide peptidase SppA [Bacteroidales bacterium]|nr:signal peptide peptidase SppA [Bacteroidales bacterium]
MKEFFKFMFASMLGFLITLIIAGFIFMAMVMAAISFTKPKEVAVNSSTILHLRLNQEITDRTSNAPFAFGAMGELESVPLGLNDIIKNLNKASEDERIKGIFLELSFVPSGMATLEEIRGLLEKFKSSGKFVIAYGEAMDQKAYYLATVADKLYLHPEGLIEFRGLNSELVFIRGLLEKMDVETQIIRHGEYKSAVEPLILDRMSEANREQTTALAQTIWGNMVSHISESRNLSHEDLNRLADNLTAFRAADALNAGLIDSVLYKDEVLHVLAQKAGLEKLEKINILALKKYNNVIVKDASVSRDKIAVIFAEGDIVQGKSDEQTIGSDDLSLEIRTARENLSVKAIVLRINSPGGDGLASDVIWREVQLAGSEKPVIVSMGNLAASGGYYIACPATKILAHPSTITGSIGVFGVIPYLGKMFSNKLGITFDRVTTNKNSDFLSLNKPLTPFQREVMQNFVDDFYATFAGHVAEGRKMTYEGVDKIGEGRVWSGASALELGLIDEYGGLEKAIELAAGAAGITEYRVVEYPVYKEPFIQLMEDLMGESSVKLARHLLGEYYPTFNTIERLNSMEGIQARMPYDLYLR